MNPETFLSQIHEQETTAKAVFQNFNSHLEHIREYRYKMLVLAKSIQSYIVTAFNSDISNAQLPFILQICRLGINIAADVTLTRIYVQKSTGWEKICPEITADVVRKDCIEIYDTLLAYVKLYDPMFIPNTLERTAPTHEKLQFIHKAYFSLQVQRAQKVQSNSQKLNHLFGSRG